MTTAFAAAHLLVSLGIGAGAIRHARSARDLPMPRREPEPRRWPSVLVCVPARNEARGVRRCLRSIAGQRYPGRFAVVAADDHSTDATASIMAEVAREFPRRLRCIAVPDLPPGWMGKCHALACAVQAAPFVPDYVLFTDADVVFAPRMLMAAVREAERTRADMLVAAPSLVTRGFWEAAVMPVACFLMMAGTNVRRIESQDRRAYIGIGAFNLLRWEMYAGFGGHAAIRSEVLDDVALGMKVKERGGRLRLVRALEGIRLRMYVGLAEIVEGFSKNAHTGAGGGWLWPLLWAAMLLFHALAPLAVLGAGELGLALGMWALPALLVGAVGKRVCIGAGWRAGALWPLGEAVFAAIILRSTWIGNVRGEIRWRGRRLARRDQQVKVGVRALMADR
jgi:glycosyltransferase involved in cell wall biosynthesis